MSGRPAPSEAAPYYFTYIDQVRGDDPVREMKLQLEESREYCASISEQVSLSRYAPDKWSIRQVLNHISDTERSFAFRALWFARGFQDALPSYEQEIAAAGALADRIPWARHCEEFEHVRKATISLFENMPEEAWLRSGIASGKSFTVRALAFITAGHFAHHLRILRELYRA